MKRKILSLIGIALLATGCGEVPKLENGKDAVVSFKNGEMISVDDLYTELKDTYGLASLVKMIDKYVLEKTFPSYIEEAQEYAESYMAALKENYDTEEELLSEIQSYTGFSTVEAYQEYIYLSYMQSYATSEYAKDQITDKQIEKYYKDEVVGDIEVSHILITPEVTDEMTEDEITKAEENAKAKAEEILEELKNVKTDEIATKFAELAKEYSDDADTKENGGSLGKINKGTLSSKYDELTDAAYTLKDGSYYSKVVTTELGYHIVLRTKSYDKASLEDSKEEIIEILSEELISEDSSISVTSLKYYRNELGMEIEDSTLQTQYAYYIQNQLTSNK